jgi:hypothetical protein
VVARVRSMLISCVVVKYILACIGRGVGDLEAVQSREYMHVANSMFLLKFSIGVRGSRRQHNSC